MQNILAAGLSDLAHKFFSLLVGCFECVRKHGGGLRWGTGKMAEPVKALVPSPAAYGPAVQSPDPPW